MGILMGKKKEGKKKKDLPTYLPYFSVACYSNTIFFLKALNMLNIFYDCSCEKNTTLSHICISVLVLYQHDN